MKKKKLYFKIYENKNKMNVHFVESYENILHFFSHETAELKADKNYLSLIFEPILLAEKEFNKLPKFVGF